MSPSDPGVFPEPATPGQDAPGAPSPEIDPSGTPAEAPDSAPIPADDPLGRPIDGSTFGAGETVA